MKKNALRDKLLRNTTLEDVAILSQSEVFHKRELITTPVPMINVALSGLLDGGLLAGLLMLAGQSKHFKTGFGLLLVSSFLKKYSDGVVLFYDSEFGTNETYFSTFGINIDNIVHSPITNAESFRSDIAAQIEKVERGEPLMIFVDSIGSLASLKEVEDALAGKDKADFTRAKTFKSIFRIVGPHLTLKNIPMVVVNHTYKEIGPYPRDIISGGTGAEYGANDIWIIGRQQDKEKDKELQGYNFIINVEKSRTVKEKSKIAINVTFEQGINKYSGLWDNALEGGFITSPSTGFYSVKGSDVKVRRGQIDTDDTFWEDMIRNKDFIQFIESKYTLGSTPIIGVKAVEVV